MYYVQPVRLKLDSICQDRQDCGETEAESGQLKMQNMFIILDMLQRVNQRDFNVIIILFCVF